MPKAERAKKRTSSTKGTVPPYGSKEYWEKRYRKHPAASSIVSTESKVEEEKEDSDVVVEALPNHEWYFTYDELRPLMLPLLLGGREEAAKMLDIVEIEEEEESENEIDEEENENTTPPSSTSVPRFQGPATVLEVGCGDVPLGVGLAEELGKLQETTGYNANSVLKKLICCDYSETVISILQNQERQESKITPEYQALDARNLPFANESIQLILEKGTLDSMLSNDNNDTGVSDCSYCHKGYILLVSHVNAHTKSGMNWLWQVVMTGLQQVEAGWEVEVHGHDETDTNNNDTDLAAYDGPPSGSPGPAVYIIQKVPRREVDSEEEEVKISFFSY